MKIFCRTRNLINVNTELIYSKVNYTSYVGSTKEQPLDVLLDNSVNASSFKLLCVAFLKNGPLIENSAVINDSENDNQ